jgi:hypothetical protein
MDFAESNRTARILRFTSHAAKHIQRVALPPGDWVQVHQSVEAMLIALERGDLDAVDRERQLMETRLRDVRQDSEAKLDAAVVEAPQRLRSAAERLSNKIDVVRSARGHDEKRE